MKVCRPVAASLAAATVLTMGCSDDDRRELAERGREAGAELGSQAVEAGGQFASEQGRRIWNKLSAVVTEQVDQREAEARQRLVEAGQAAGQRVSDHVFQEVAGAAALREVITEVCPEQGAETCALAVLGVAPEIGTYAVVEGIEERPVVFDLGGCEVTIGVRVINPLGANAVPRGIDCTPGATLPGAVVTPPEAPLVPVPPLTSYPAVTTP